MINNIFERKNLWIGTTADLNRVLMSELVRNKMHFPNFYDQQSCERWRNPIFSQWENTLHLSCCRFRPSDFEGFPANYCPSWIFVNNKIESQRIILVIFLEYKSLKTDGISWRSDWKENNSVKRRNKRFKIDICYSNWRFGNFTFLKNQERQTKLNIFEKTSQCNLKDGNLRPTRKKANWM